MNTSNYEFLFEGMVILPGDSHYTRVWIEQHSWKTEVIAKDQWDWMIHNSVTNVVVNGDKVSFTTLPDGDKVEWSFRPYVNTRS